MKIAVVDFEIANSNYNSACSVGIVVIDGLQIIDEEYFLIRPPGLVVDEEMSKIHGLTKRDLIVAFNFDFIWLKIQKYFTGDYLIAAHNAYFDMNVLKNALLLTEEQTPNFIYFDTISYTTPVCQGIGNALSDRLKHFNITLDHAHNALADARATAELIIKATEAASIKNVEQFLLLKQVAVKEFKDLKMTTEFKVSKKKAFSKKKINDISTDVDYFDENHPLFDSHVVFTGDLATMDRKTAAQAVTNLGGIVKNTVSRKTKFLVVGPQDPKLVGSKGLSTKEIKAMELIEKGYGIAIIDEATLLQLLNFKSPEEDQSLVDSASVLEERAPKPKKVDEIVFRIGMD